MRVIKPNGDIIECSVEEYEYLQAREQQRIVEEQILFQPEPELEELDSEPEVLVPDPEMYIGPRDTVLKKHKVRTSLCTHWTRAEEKLLKQNITMPTKKLVKLFPGRTETALNAKRAKVKRGLKRKYTVNPEKSKYKHEKMAFVNQRANEIWATNGKKDRKKALELAMFEWNLKEKAKAAEVNNVQP